MGKIIKKQIQGMNWWTKISLVLILTLASSVFMFEGWYKPKPAQAAITQLVNWTKAYDQVSGTGSAFNVTVPTGSGTNRLMVVGITQTDAAAGTQADPTPITYGGVTLTKATDNGTTNNRMHTWLYYLKNNAVMDNTARPLNVTLAGTHANFQVWVAVFDGVDQAAALTTGNNSINASGSGPAQLSAAMAVNTNQQAVYIVNVVNASNTTLPTYTINANWTSRGTSTASSGTTAWDVDVATRTIPVSNTTDNAATSAIAPAGTIRYAISAMSLPMAVVVDSTPPIAGTVTVNPDIASNYTSPAPTITTQFTDLESAVTSCQYTTNGGTTWTAGVVSGAGPYTCTASPVGLSGALTINMRATSTGGTGTATAIARTVDTSVPTDGTLTVTSGNLQNSLSWTAAVDAGSGISSYILRYATGVVAPASCAVGTAVPGSPFSAATLSTTHTGLTNGTQYSYRLCATDNIGNTSGGATGSATPTALVSTITSCGGCHGYKTTFTDGASRNAGGLFQGSHNKHVITQTIVCSTCHVAPATETSADYGHSTGQIQMAASINGGTYSKASPFPVSNTFTPGTCSGTSCHAAVYATTSGTSPSWGTPGGGCGACHTGSPGVFQANGAPNTGGHNIHMTAGAVCGNCHAGAVTAVTGGTRHGNGFINLTTGYTSPTRNQATKRAAGGTYYTCTAASCHADPYSSGTVTTNVWSPVSSGCGACHKNAANNSNLGAFITYSAPSTQVGPATASHDEHLNYGRYVCGDCHAGAVSGTTGGTNHGNGVVNIIQYAGTVTKHAQPFTYLANGCAAACHITATWGSQLGCINCHASTITRRKGRVGDVLDAVTTEFGLAWGHKKTGRGAVTDADCIVCHLEGNSTTLRTSKYHADGNIDLRDPTSLTREAPITNMTGAAWTFQRFSTSYAAGTRTTTGNTANTIDNIITQKFCLGCHQSTGAVNPGARSGTAPTQYFPFGTGANTGYALGISAGVVGGVFDAKSQFATTNASYHPVIGPLNKGWPTAARLLPPYNNIVRVGGTKSNSVVINCFDCHNVATPTTPLTLRTVSAHGNAVTLRGPVRVSGTTATAQLCLNCHTTNYSASAQNHGANSAFSGGADSAMNSRFSSCYYCHGTATAGANVTGATQVRPIRAVEVHGFNDRTQGTVGSKWGTGARPYAFIRNSLSNWGPASATTETLTNPHTCSGTGGTCDNNMGNSSYTPGGAY